MCPHFSHPVGVSLVLVKLLVVLLKNQSLIVGSIEQKGNTGQKGKNAEQYGEYSENLSNARVAHEIHKTRPLSGAGRFPFAAGVGAGLCAFGFFCMFTGVSGHGAIQLKEVRLRFAQNDEPSKLFIGLGSIWTCFVYFQQLYVRLG